MLLLIMKVSPKVSQLVLHFEEFAEPKNKTKSFKVLDFKGLAFGVKEKWWRRRDSNPRPS